MNKCSYGCNQTAQFILKNGKECCGKSWNSCPIIKAKNSKGLKESHASGSKGYTYNPKSAWNRGSNAFSDGRINANYTIESLFTYGQKGPHKAVLIQEKGHRCESCQLEIWQTKPIPLELDHIDGDSENNIRENLRLLCNNCHALTPTWRRRKPSTTGRTKHTEQEMISAIMKSSNINQCLKILGLKWGSYQTIERCRMRNNLSFGSDMVKNES